MIADDDPATVEILAYQVAKAGYHPVTACNGLTALQVLSEYQPHIAILDWLMPEMDGLSLARALRSQQNGCYVYIIMLTVESTKARLLEAFDAGVDDFLGKPFYEGELLARVRAGQRMIDLYDRLVERTASAQRLNQELCRLNGRLQEVAMLDDLTGLFNRRQAISRLVENVAMARRGRLQLSCMMADIDQFKQVNDTFGHLKGDEVLQRVARMISGCVRSSDIACRIGGEEFLVILPGMSSAQAMNCAERCRGVIHAAALPFQKNGLPVTISVGVAEYDLRMNTIDDLLGAADAALYAAKNSGRNNVKLHPQVDSAASLVAAASLVGSAPIADADSLQRPAKHAVDFGT